MRRRALVFLGVALLVAALVALAGCGDDEDEGVEAVVGTRTEEQAEMHAVTLQLKSATQAQFAGYYAAKDQGYYEEEGLDVTIRPGGPAVVAEQVVLGGQAEFGLNWLDHTLATRDQGGDIINIAQVFTRSGMTEITWKDSGIDDITKLRGKKVGVWLGGNEHKLFAALNQNGLDPRRDVQIVAQPFDMNLFLSRKIDAATAMTYDQLAQVLEQENPDTGELYTLDDLNVFKLSDLGAGALEDGVFVRSDWIGDEANQDIAKRFLKASFRGWVFCRDNQEECLQVVLENDPTLGEGHQRWALNEINDLIWPAPLGIGVMHPESWEITKQIALDYGIIKNPPEDAKTYRTDLAEAAVAALKADGVDVNGENWQKEEVEPTRGGQ
jgi:NitT/TauT family transport system substrate-binding protein